MASPKDDICTDPQLREWPKKEIQAAGRQSWPMVGTKKKAISMSLIQKRA